MKRMRMLSAKSAAPLATYVRICHNGGIRKSYRFRLYPTHAQKRQFEQTLELCRWVYNETLATRKRAWQERGKSVSLYDTNKLLTQWKRECPELKQVFSQVLQDVQVRVDLAFKAFFRRMKAGEEPGYPRFKGKGRYDSITFKQFGFDLTDTLNLSKIGSIKIKRHRPIEGEIKRLTVTRNRLGKWYACFSCEVERKPLPRTERYVGVDCGLYTYLALSDGNVVENPRFFRRDEKALAKAQRRFSKCEKGTPERRKYSKVVCRIHERIANRRSNFAHQTSRQLVNSYDLIAFEKLNIEGMLQNGNLARSIADASWRQFRQYTLYKAEEAGRTCVEVNPCNTSRQCSRCKQLVAKDLSVRIHACPHCGLTIDRDLNAAINILTLGMQSVGFEP
jgi:putative transposase